MVGNCILLFRAFWLTTALRYVSLPGDGVLAPIAIVIVAASLVFFIKKDKVFALILLLAPLLGNLIKFLLKIYYSVPRPEVFGCDVLVSYGDKYAFPSGHTIFYTVFFGLLAYYAIKNWSELWAKFVLPISILMIASIGYSRIYLGAHWYLDVFAGYLIGGTILVISILIYEYILRGNDASH